MNRQNGSMRKEIDMALKNVEWNEQQKSQVFAEIEKRGRRSRRAGVRVAVALGLCLVMTATVFAVNGTLFERVQNWLGAFGGYVVPLENRYAKDQGIEISLIGAVSDSHESKLYFSVQDLEGDRLDGAMNASYQLDIEASDDSAAAGSFLKGVECIGYDPDTETALLEVFYRGATRPDYLRGSIRFKELQPGIVQVGAPLPMEKLSSNVLPVTTVTDGLSQNGQPDEEGYTALVPEQTPAEISGAEGLRLSSFGFGEDGWLHLQIRLTDEALNLENRSDFSLLTTVNSKSDEWNASWKYNQQIKEAVFSYDGNRYADIAFLGAAPEDLNDIGQCELYGFYTVKEKIEGDWHIKINTEILQERTVDADEMIGEIRVTRVILSDIAVTVESKCDEPKLLSKKPLLVHFSDGSTVTAKAVSGSRWSRDSDEETGISVDRWSWETPIDASQVIAVEIGKCRIEL